MSQTTRRQHYVWRFHLSAWEVDGKVAVLRRDGRGFSTKAANVAVERDFYKLPRLTKTDVEFIEGFIDLMPQSDEQKASARGWLEAPALAAHTRALLKSRGALTPEAEAAVEAFEIEVDERMMGNIERRGQPWVERLREGDAAFWADDAAAIDFCHFLSVQHLRTKRIADALSEGLLASGQVYDFSRIWPIMRHILSGNMGFSIYSQRRDWALRVVKAGGALRFITGDQPVMNLLAAEHDEDMALYYPVSPTVAALLEHRDAASAVGDNDILGDEEVGGLNRRIFDYRHEQSIGSDLAYLRALDA